MGPIAKNFAIIAKFRYDSENLISQCVRNFAMRFFFFFYLGYCWLFFLTWGDIRTAFSLHSEILNL